MVGLTFWGVPLAVLIQFATASTSNERVLAIKCGDEMGNG